MGDVVFGNPIAKVGGKEKKLFVICFNEGGLEGILWLRGTPTQGRFEMKSKSTKGFGRLRRRRLRPEPLVDFEPRGKGSALAGREEKAKVERLGPTDS